MRELPRIVANTPIGKAVDVTIIRKGKTETVKVTLGRLEEGEKTADASTPGADQPAAPPAPEKVLGMTLGDLDDAARTKFKIGADVKGVVVTDVEAGSAAGEKRVQAGDTIVEVSQEAVKTPADVAAAIKKLKDQDRKSALFLLANPAGELRFVAVKVE